MAVNGWTRKSLLTIEDLKPDEISLILDIINDNPIRRYLYEVV